MQLSVEKLSKKTTFGKSTPNSAVDRPMNINVIEVYTPTTDEPEEDIGDFHKHVHNALRRTTANRINKIRLT